MRCPKSRFPIQIIVFDELELIIFVSQSLTLSTASLVYHKNHCSIFLSYTFNFNTVSHTRPQGTRLLILDLGQLLKSLPKKELWKISHPLLWKYQQRLGVPPFFTLVAIDLGLFLDIGQTKWLILQFFWYSIFRCDSICRIAHVCLCLSASDLFDL